MLFPGFLVFPLHIQVLSTVPVLPPRKRKYKKISLWVPTKFLICFEKPFCLFISKQERQDKK